MPCRGSQAAGDRCPCGTYWAGYSENLSGPPLPPAPPHAAEWEKIPHVNCLERVSPQSQSRRLALGRGEDGVGSCSSAETQINSRWFKGLAGRPRALKEETSKVLWAGGRPHRGSSPTGKWGTLPRKGWLRANTENSPPKRHPEAEGQMTTSVARTQRGE